MALTTPEELMMIEAQMHAIKTEVDLQLPLSTPEPLTRDCQLTSTFQHDSVFAGKIASLVQGLPNKYVSIRYARRDGNCFYRCAAFQLFCLMQRDVMFAAYCTDVMKSLRPRLIAQYGDYSADFSDVVEEAAAKITSGVWATPDHIRDVVSGEEGSYIIVYFRYVVSLQIRLKEEDILPFVLGLDYPSVEAYCVAEVEPVDHVSDNIQLVAFAELFDVLIRVEMLDRNPGKTTTTIVLNDSCKRDKCAINLLFQPGHYDLLEG